jgi:hypothetical protein
MQDNLGWNLALNSTLYCKEDNVSIQRESRLFLWESIVINNQHTSVVYTNEYDSLNIA